MFEAVTSHRPNRDPMTSSEAIEQIRAGAGTDFDPELVSAFERLYIRGRTLIESDPMPRTDLSELPLPEYQESPNLRTPARTPAKRAN